MDMVATNEQLIDALAKIHATAADIERKFDTDPDFDRQYELERLLADVFVAVAELPVIEGITK